MSLAYLKELCLSSLMRKIGEPDGPSIDDVLIAQVETLRSQMSSRETN